MPIYEYECLECGARFEKLQRFGDSAAGTCPNGHRNVHRLFSQPAIIFKGSGFYITDNGKSSRTRTSRNGTQQKDKEAEPAASTDREKTTP
jgi:putative FmdB family regulatory protein